MANPYESPHETAEPAEPAERFVRPRGIAFGRALAWLYPLSMLASLYVTWLIAWVVLGHMPRPSLDDPKSIGGAVDIAYLMTGLLLMGFPVGVVFGIAASLTLPNFNERLLCVMKLVLVWVAVFFLLRWDPLGVVNWYMD